MQDADADFDDTVIVSGVRSPVPESIALEDTIPLASPKPTAQLSLPRRAPAPPARPWAAEWFAIRVGDHEPILLDLPTIVGRQPTAPRISGGPLPRLVRVPSPEREVSSSHVRFEQVGQSVVVFDLGSTNGTRLSNPSSPPLMLRRGDSAVALPGALVEVGDDVVIEIVGVSGD